MLTVDDSKNKMVSATQSRLPYPTPFNQRFELGSSHRPFGHLQLSSQLLVHRYMINIFHTYTQQKIVLSPSSISTAAASQCLATPALQSPWAPAVLEHLAQAHPKACSALLNASTTARTLVLSSNAESAQLQTVSQKWVQAVQQTNVPRASTFQSPRLRAPETSDLVWPVQ